MLGSELDSKQATPESSDAVHHIIADIVEEVQDVFLKHQLTHGEIELVLKALLGAEEFLKLQKAFDFMEKEVSEVMTQSFLAWLHERGYDVKRIRTDDGQLARTKM